MYIAGMRSGTHVGLLVVGILAAPACGPTSRRDADVPARAVTYDDACGLQAYFDERREAKLAPPAVVDESIASDEKGVTAGIGTYVLKDPMVRRRFAKLLRDEYKGIEPQVVGAVESSEGEVKVRVHWWDAGATRRLRVGKEIVVYTKAGSTELPPNPCVADLLFGAKIYEMRHRYVTGELNRAIEGSPDEAAPAASTPAPATSATPVVPVTPSASAGSSATHP